MRTAWRQTLLVGLVVALVSGALPVAQAQNPAYGVDGRVFPEAMMSTSFLQWPDFIAGLETLDTAYPDYLDVREIGRSIEGRPILFVEITNEKSDKAREEKLQIGYSASIHANEAAGREGMVRVIEDLASGTGPLGGLRPMLDDLIVTVWFPNPDSWASGDYFTVDPARVLEGNPSYYRGNTNGTDLNRQFPSPGAVLKGRTPMSEPESRAVVEELRYSGRHSNLVAGTDLHGMINSPNMMRAIIPNQDMDFHRMMVTIRFLKDLEDRVNNSPNFTEWNTLAEALCLLPQADVPPAAEHAHADEALAPELQAVADLVDDDDGIWTLQEAQAFADAADCGTLADGPTGGVGHGRPFLWGARWDQIGYTDSGFTSDYLMLSPRSPTGGMGAVGTITEFAYSHMVPNNNYVAKLNDMHVAGVRETVRAQMEYTLLLEKPRLVGAAPAAYLVNTERITSDTDPNAYKSQGGNAFDLADKATWFDFEQVPYDVANTDFWVDLSKSSDSPVDGLLPSDVAAETLAGYETLVLTDHTYHRVDPALIRDWVESGGTLILTDAALGWFDEAGLTTGAAYEETSYYLGHSDLTDPSHPLLKGVDWNARATAEAIPIGYAMNEYPQWHLKADALSGLDVAVAGTTGGDPSLGTAKVGQGKVHFIGAALAQPTQQNDHRYGLAPYALQALTYYVFVNALGGAVEWVPIATPFVPEYPADPLYGGRTADVTKEPETSDTPAPQAIAILALLGLVVAVLTRRRQA